jgi:predicted ATPase
MLKSLKVKNFKSLRDAQFNPKPLSVLVGPNSSGKSNLFDVFRSVRDIVRGGSPPVRPRDWFNTAVWSGEIDSAISFEFSGKFHHSQRELGFQYLLELSGSQFGWFRVSKESVTVSEGNVFHVLLEFPDKQNMASSFDLEGRQLGSHNSTDAATSYLHGFRSDGVSILGTLSAYLQSWEVYDPSPVLMRGYVPVKHELRLAPEGQNLAGVLHTIHSEFPDIFTTIEDRLQALVPESRKLLSLLTEEGATQPGLLENDVSSKVPASAMSAGTLRFLAFLAVLYSPDAPPLVCFEEPENNLHPYALELLMDVLKSASRKRQVLISTHSPHLLNLVDPESVFIFDKGQGETKITEACTRKNLKSLTREVGLGEAWYAGTIGGVPARTR